MQFRRMLPEYERDKQKVAAFCHLYRWKLLSQTLNYHFRSLSQRKDKVMVASIVRLYYAVKSTEVPATGGFFFQAPLIYNILWAFIESHCVYAHTRSHISWEIWPSKCISITALKVAIVCRTHLYQVYIWQNTRSASTSEFVGRQRTSTLPAIHRA
jgi:hypothetical protein